MLTAVFKGHLQFVLFAVIISCIAGAVIFTATRRRNDQPLTWALWGACVTATIALTTWTTAPGDLAASCTVNRDILEPFRHTQGQLNFGMLVPFGLLGTLATRRPGLMVGLSFLFPAAIETTQALAPISRACDTSDLVANGLGALLGTAIGTVIARFRGGTPLARKATRRAFISAGAMACAIGVALYTLADLVIVDRTESNLAATAEQKSAIDARLEDAFGGAYRAQNYSVTSGGNDAGTITAIFENGMAELSWPDRRDFTVSLPPADIEAGRAFAVPGAQLRPSDKKKALLIAETYARRFAPWGLKDSKVNISRVDEEEDLGWLVYWRRWDGKVLLPMRLDLRIDSAGRVSDLIERNIADPIIPSVQVSKGEAWDVFEKNFSDEIDEDAERGEPILLAQYRDGRWHVDWLLSTRTSLYALEAAIDATDGSFNDPVQVPLRHSNDTNQYMEPVPTSR
ncbi:VanZ family protein (plasmid) [Streptomyces sp. NBC_01201]|uniref:VanZ family protein n=1 Tax=Streptomyces sp. NBC_01201 TaxID=2903770 RepID=UPI002E167A17|nr:VanZ family protein [Streptomyces sp. NBC_01201]